MKTALARSAMFLLSFVWIVPTITLKRTASGYTAPFEFQQNPNVAAIRWNGGAGSSALRDWSLTPGHLWLCSLGFGVHAVSSFLIALGSLAGLDPFLLYRTLHECLLVSSLGPSLTVEAARQGRRPICARRSDDATSGLLQQMVGRGLNHEKRAHHWRKITHTLGLVSNSQP